MVTDEKAKYLKEAVKLAGIESLVHFSAWAVTSLVIMEIVIITITILYKVRSVQSYI